MRTISAKELTAILPEHAKWLQDSTVGQRANLSGVDLSYANLSGANLRGVNLSDADLRGANLSYVDLRGADLRRADLSGVDLKGVNLSDADLRGAYLSDADLKGAKLPDFQLVPDEGSFIAWKKVSNGGIVKLLIPEDAKRTSSLVGRKCRASKAVVLEVFDYNGASINATPEGKSYPGIIYEKGETVEPDSYDDDIRVECAHGIHFFITRKEAENY